MEKSNRRETIRQTIPEKWKFLRVEISAERIKARNFCHVERKGYTTFSERGIIVPVIAVFTPFERDTILLPLSRRSGSLWTGFKIIKGNPFRLYKRQWPKFTSRIIGLRDLEMETQSVSLTRRRIRCIFFINCFIIETNCIC